MARSKDTAFGIAMRNFTKYPEIPSATGLIEYGVRMEELGYESIWAWDHILLGVTPSFPIHEALTILTAIAARTLIRGWPFRKDESTRRAHRANYTRVVHTDVSAVTKRDQATIAPFSALRQIDAQATFTTVRHYAAGVFDAIPGIHGNGPSIATVAKTGRIAGIRKRGISAAAIGLD